MDEQGRPPLRLMFAILLGAGLLGVLAIMPYLTALLGDLLAQSPIPLPLLLAAQFLQSTVLLSIAVGVGLRLARKTGLGAPIIEAALMGEDVGARVRSMLRVAVPAGIAVGIAILLLVLFVFAPRLPQLPFLAERHIALWKRALASLYGGITEELLTRLFLFTLLVWLLGKVWRRKPDGLAATGSLWAANIFIAIIFGLGHLPAASMTMQITPLVVVAALLLNGIASVTFGYLYWKHGLEAAMVAHFSADVVFHVIGPTLF
jgi:hypothetical protein